MALDGDAWHEKASLQDLPNTACHGATERQSAIPPNPATLQREPIGDVRSIAPGGQRPLSAGGNPLLVSTSQHEPGSARCWRRQSLALRVNITDGQDEGHVGGEDQSAAGKVVWRQPEARLVTEHEREVGVPLKDRGGLLKSRRIAKVNALREDDQWIARMPQNYPFDELLKPKPSITQLPAAAEHDRLTTDGVLESPRTISIRSRDVVDRDLPDPFEIVDLGNPDQVIANVAMTGMVEQSAVLGFGEGGDLRQPSQHDRAERGDCLRLPLRHSPNLHFNRSEPCRQPRDMRSARAMHITPAVHGVRRGNKIIGAAEGKKAATPTINPSRKAVESAR